MIHVAVIVALWSICTGYDFRICFFVVDTFTNEKNKTKMDLNIMEITYINELALTVGLILLTIGNFLGGQWAKSWGRYWGWDPKETWALISIMVLCICYSFQICTCFAWKMDV
jgi:ABC-type transport system involved in cytochrome c biogenesis permease subunit